VTKQEEIDESVLMSGCGDFAVNVGRTLLSAAFARDPSCPFAQNEPPPIHVERDDFPVKSCLEPVQLAANFGRKVISVRSRNPKPLQGTQGEGTPAHAFCKSQPDYHFFIRT